MISDEGVYGTIVNREKKKLFDGRSLEIKFTGFSKKKKEFVEQNTLSSVNEFDLFRCLTFVSN